MMKFGNAAWGFRETPLEKQLRITADMGLGYLELGIANAPNDIPLDVQDSEIEHIKELSAQYGVNILHAATGNDFTAGIGDVAKVKRVMDICDKLNIQYLRIFTGFTPLSELSETAYADMLSALTSVCDYAAKKHVVPVMEIHGAVKVYDDGVEHIMSTTTDLGTLVDIMQRIPENARICYDPANLYAVGRKNAADFYENLKDKIAYAHFKEFMPLPSGHLSPSYCGAGNMDWKNILKSMADFDGVVMFEYENTEDVEAGLQRCYDYMIKEQKGMER